MKILLWWSLSFALCGLAVAASKDPVFEQFRDAFRQADAERAAGRTASEADILYADPTWETRMATFLAKQVMACVYSGNLDQLNAAMNRPGRPRPLPDEEFVRLNGPRQGELQRHGQAMQARLALVNTLTGIEHIKDPRLVRLFGPLVTLKTIETEYEKGDSPNMPTPERSAWTHLMSLRLHDVIPGRKPPGQDDTDWVEWWKANQDQYGPIPEPLRDIAEKYAAAFNPPATAANDKPPTTPPRKRVPRVGSQSPAEESGSVPTTIDGANSANNGVTAFTRRHPASTLVVGGCLLASLVWFVLRRREKR